MPWLAVTGGGGGTEWPTWAIVLFLIAFVLVGVFVLIKRRGR
ncbi:hypothetical protein [Micromonospora vulcania]|uniref:LPXTG cell wall anchor domain-containing protein n=1 Tax=Micromonospora vulcania TaxID=1441873 RepID=A0ABW1HE04_9ACTN